MWRWRPLRICCFHFRIFLYIEESSIPRSAPMRTRTATRMSMGIQDWLREAIYEVWLETMKLDMTSRSSAPSAINIPATALLPASVGKRMLRERRTAITAPGVGMPRKMMNSVPNQPRRGDVPCRCANTLFKANIRTMVRGKTPVNAPTRAERQWIARSLFRNLLFRCVYTSKLAKSIEIAEQQDRIGQDMLEIVRRLRAKIDQQNRS